MASGIPVSSRKHLSTRRRCACAVLATIPCLLTVGCIEPLPASNRARIQHEEPSVRIKAIVEAGRERDDKAVPLIVDRLEDEDEGVRLYAIIALEKITGERFGYDYGDSMSERAGAVERWRNFVRRRVAQSNEPGKNVIPQSNGSAEGLPGSP